MIHRKLNTQCYVNINDLVYTSKYYPTHIKSKSKKTVKFSTYKESVLDILYNYNLWQYHYYSLNNQYLKGIYTFPLFFNKYAQNYEPDFYSQKIFERYQSHPFIIEEHSINVAKYCFQLGRALGIKGKKLERLELAGLLHDIGKTSIPNHILNKNASLSPEEWVIMKSHTLMGYDILNTNDQFKDISMIARSHHERIDGSGYPDQLKEDQIPYLAKIVSVTDAYEAMTSDRPYKKALTKEEAMKELIKHSGTQFDSDIVQKFIHEVLN
ncbi:HD-GYP domain-containing protein [Mycoplasmatota bacterium]|nr:HD-GYP domain-containing protein [Mycoplasmatota bacterium]